MIHSARHEREGDLGAMQDLLDRSYTATCAHLLRIHTAERRLRAEQVVERLGGMCLLASPQSRPTAVPSSDQSTESSPGGAFLFASAPDSLRFRHIRARPRVSATYLPSEALAVTVHRHATPLDIQSEADRRTSPDAARHLRAPLRCAVGGLPRLRPGVRAHRSRPHVRVRDADGLTPTTRGAGQSECPRHQLFGGDAPSRGGSGEGEFPEPV